VIRQLGLANAGLDERRVDRVQEFAARRRAIEAALLRLDELERAERIDPATIERLRAQHRERLLRVQHRSADDDAQRAEQERQDAAEFSLIEAERACVNDLYRHGELKDESRRRIERELDLREARLNSFRGE
jgi:CPA1 family monovalent cation:H+ antiporter